MRHDKARFCPEAYDLLRIINTLNTSGKINDFYSLINNREVNIYTVIFSINSKSGRCQEMAAETGIERGRIRLYHKHAVIMQMSHSRHSDLLHHQCCFVFRD